MDHLPVFLDLRGRRVLVVGGGAVAARKVELLRAAQARVRLVAPQLTAEFTRRHTGGVDPEIEYLAATFVPSHLDGAVLAIAATDDAQINRAVARAGEARGVFVNVVDDGEASSCLMPAIVDRSPLLVAIGTGGASPTLARRVRAQIEALLPDRLGALARLAGGARARVAQALPDIQARRRFWDRLFSGPTALRALEGQDAEAAALLEQTLQSSAEAEARGDADAGEGAPRRGTGEVYLIGAGPGDADLLTLRAQHLLQQADVVLYDRLVSESVLARARRDAERVFVGKETGHHRVTQQRIHSLLVDYARRGLRVARLKGGDPLIFGRGGEEIDVLVREGIAFTVVPGITAALGAAAAVGLPLTQRGVAHAVLFVTAMGQGAEALDWRALAAPMQTVVFYMGVAQLPRIVEHLERHGAPADRPAALIERATLPQQRLLVSTLGGIEGLAAAERIEAPALLIVGDAVRSVAPGTRRRPDL